MDRNKSGIGQRRGGTKGREKGSKGQQRGGHQGNRGLDPPTSPKVSSELSKLEISPVAQPIPPPGMQNVPTPTLPQTGACALPQDTGVHTPLNPTSESILSSKGIISNIPPNRPGYGTYGNEVPIIVNSIKIVIPSIVIYQYDVKIYDVLLDGSIGERNIIEKYVCKMIMSSLSQGELVQCYPAYNGRSILYCRDDIKGRYEVAWKDRDDGDRERRHLVELKHAALVDLSLISELTLRNEQFPSRDERDEFLAQHQAATNAVDAIFRQFAAATFTPVGRAFYNTEESYNLDGGLCLCEGFSQSVRPGQKQVHLNIDMSYRPFVKPMDVLKFLYETLKLEDLFELKDPRIQRQAAHELSMLEIYTDHLLKPKKCKIKDMKNVFLAPANKESFLLEEKQTTVQDYFKMRYGIVLKYPDLPCLNVGKGKRVNALPMEVCRIKAGQTTKQELGIKQKREMIELTSNPPNQRFEDIEYFASQALPVKNEILEHFKITTGSMVEAFARILPPPVIKYDKDEVRGAKGNWQIKGLFFFKPIAIKVWVILHFSNRARSFNYIPLINEIQKQSGSKGMEINRPINEEDIYEKKFNTFSTDLRRNGLDDIKRLMEFMLERFGRELQMILCIIDRDIRGDTWNSDSVYNRIKLVGDTQLSIITQCIDQKNAFKPNGSTIGGLCLKMNAKQGGINHFAVVKETESLLLGAMIIGADVNHPKPGMGMQEFPSIAAGCVALDSKFSRYYGTCRFQKNRHDPTQRQEVILDFENVCSELLIEFMRENRGKKPRKILYYRDGVSEGQFQAVIDLELTALKTACRKIAPDYNPPITLVCVQKRHHMKMFVDNRKRVDNVEPGTYLDRIVTHPFEYDFYLCSHVALKGTAKAGHYHVLHDENNFTPDMLYTITYQLCYCYARCTKSVSIPPPVYYADLIAYRYNLYFDPRLVRGKDPATIDWDRIRRGVEARIKPGKMFWV